MRERSRRRRAYRAEEEEEATGLLLALEPPGGEGFYLRQLPAEVFGDPPTKEALLLLRLRRLEARHLAFLADVQ